MKTGFALFEQMMGKKDIGSSRIRGHWVVRHWKDAGPDIGDAEVFKHGGKYDAIIFQKAYWTQMANAFQGVKIFDICDPDWFDWGYPFKEMLDGCDAVTASSLELTKAVANFTDKPVYFIPDRIDFDDMLPPKVHKGPTKNVVWYGYAHNFPMLVSALPALQKRNLNLIVISDDVFVIPANFNSIQVTNYPWSDSWKRDIQTGDVVINPQTKSGKWLYKSDNKTVIAKALGMPVAHKEEELDLYMTESDRHNASLAGVKVAKELFDVKLSVIDLKEIIADIQTKKKSV